MEVKFFNNILDGDDFKYLEEKFPNGDERRGDAMVLMALARREGIMR